MPIRSYTPASTVCSTAIMVIGGGVDLIQLANERYPADSSTSVADEVAACLDVTGIGEMSQAVGRFPSSLDLLSLLSLRILGDWRLFIVRSVLSRKNSIFVAVATPNIAESGV